MITKTTRIALIAAFAALTTSTTAQAADEPQIEINTSGYDLGNPAHVAKIKAGIRSAARTVCGMREENLALKVLAARKSCFSRALATANAQIDTQVAQRNSKASTAVVYQNNTTVISPKR